MTGQVRVEHVEVDDPYWHTGSTAERVSTLRTPVDRRFGPTFAWRKRILWPRGSRWPLPGQGRIDSIDGPCSRSRPRPCRCSRQQVDSKGL